MKLSEYAKEMGISYLTALRHFKSGKIPYPTQVLPSGTLIVHYEKNEIKNISNEVVIYARVSSHDQKNDLERQLQRLRDYCAKSGYRVKKEVSEIASGMNSSRKKLNSILSDGDIKYIVVENRDRLTRFGFDLIQSTLKAQNREIILINEVDCDNDLVQDLIDMVVSTCAKVYGKRSAKNKAKKVKEILNE